MGALAVALKRLRLQTSDEPAPAMVGKLLAAAHERIERFQATQVVAGFVPSDFFGAYAALRALAAGQLAPGMSLCEWGSGFGVVACLAATVGFDCWGIEVDDSLVNESRRLAADYQLPVQFHRGSFLPAGAPALLDELCPDSGDGFYWMDMHAACAEDEMGLAIEDFDVIFAYPWPGEEGILYALFDCYASLGAVLLTYHGLEGFRLHRKVKGSEDRHRRGRRPVSRRNTRA